MSDVPVIYARIEPAAGIRTGGRLLALLIALAGATALTLAVGLRPNPTGIGTHHALGLDGCGFLDRTGIPCPTCGMTTSFAWFVRGHWPASVYVQPMGFLAALLAAMVFWAALYEFVTGKPIHRLLTMLPMSYHLLPLMALTVLAWAWKIFIHVRGIDGWG